MVLTSKSNTPIDKSKHKTANSSNKKTGSEIKIEANQSSFTKEKANVNFIQSYVEDEKMDFPDNNDSKEFQDINEKTKTTPEAEHENQDNDNKYNNNNHQEKNENENNNTLNENEKDENISQSQNENSHVFLSPKKSSVRESEISNINKSNVTNKSYVSNINKSNVSNKSYVSNNSNNANLSSRKKGKIESVQNSNSQSQHKLSIMHDENEEMPLVENINRISHDGSNSKNRESVGKTKDDNNFVPMDLDPEVKDNKESKFNSAKKSEDNVRSRNQSGSKPKSEKKPSQLNKSNDILTVPMSLPISPNRELNFARSRLITSRNEMFVTAAYEKRLSSFDNIKAVKEESLKYSPNLVRVNPPSIFKIVILRPKTSCGKICG